MPKMNMKYRSPATILVLINKMPNITAENTINKYNGNLKKTVIIPPIIYSSVSCYYLFDRSILSCF